MKLFHAAIQDIVIIIGIIIITSIHTGAARWSNFSSLWKIKKPLPALVTVFFCTKKPEEVLQ